MAFRESVLENYPFGHADEHELEAQYDDKVALVDPFCNVNHLNVFNATSNGEKQLKRELVVEVRIIHFRKFLIRQQQDAINHLEDADG